MLLINEIRILASLNTCPVRSSILLQVTCDHGDLTVTAALFPYKSGDPAGSFFHLLLREFTAENMQISSCFFIYIFSVTEDIFFKEMKAGAWEKRDFPTSFKKNRCPRSPLVSSESPWII